MFEYFVSDIEANILISFLGKRDDFIFLWIGYIFECRRENIFYKFSF